MIWEFLNIFFFVFHTAIMLFNCTGWIWRKTRRLNLITLLLTSFSWFVLGYWYGWGYCLCTDWHWAVREELGYFDQSRSYVHFLILKLTGVNIDPKLVDQGTVAVFFISLFLSAGLNIRDWKKRQKVSLKK